MATVIERERPTSVLIERRDEGAGWAVAAIVIIAVLAVGAFVWARYYSQPIPAAQTNTPGASVNVTLPQTGGTGATQSSGSSDTTQSPSGSAQPQTNTSY